MSIKIKISGSNGIIKKFTKDDERRLKNKWKDFSLVDDDLVRIDGLGTRTVREVKMLQEEK